MPLKCRILLSMYLLSYATNGIRKHASVFNFLCFRNKIANHLHLYSSFCCYQTKTFSTMYIIRQHKKPENRTVCGLQICSKFQRCSRGRPKHDSLKSTHKRETKANRFQAKLQSQTGGRGPDRVACLGRWCSPSAACMESLPSANAFSRE